MNVIRHYCKTWFQTLGMNVHIGRRTFADMPLQSENHICCGAVLAMKGMGEECLGPSAEGRLSVVQQMKHGAATCRVHFNNL